LGIELVWQALEERIRSAGVPDAHAKLRSLHKLLIVEFAVMLESYKDTYSEQVRTFERQAVEEKLTRAEHLAEIGQLAASLAHEIKNPLAGISGAIQIIRDAMKPDDPHQPIVSEILGQINRLDATVKDLLHYARPTPPQFTRVPFDDVVTRVLTILRQEPALQRVRIKYGKLTPDTALYGDAAQIEQLLINLILNAAHASDNGGLIHLGIADNGDEVSLTVTDEGRGMTPEVRARAFEPFFTTKAKGTGLGLSICRRIVETHGGDIELESDVGHGTTVTVRLPRGDSSKARKLKS
jgi:signal transduction histidine kinase